MVIRSHPRSFCCFTQHHHAEVAAQLAAHWPQRRFAGLDRRDDVLLAIREHDRGWIPLDAAPCWNEQQQAPYSFLDYPLMPKLRLYQRGVEEVTVLSPYAGLLCSLHYSSLPRLTSSGPGTAFLRQEARRQRHLRRQLGLTRSQQTEVQFHLNLLKFCDGLSLYLCLSEPGEMQPANHRIYQECVPAPGSATEPGLTRLQATWTNPETVRLRHSPFEQPFTVALRYVELPKATGPVRKLASGYGQAPVQQRLVRVE